MHPRTVPVGVTERLGMVVDRKTIFLSGSFQEVTRDPDLVASAVGAFGKNLEFPLACSDLSVDTLNVQTGF